MADTKNARIAKIATPRRDAEGNDAVSLELIIQAGGPGRDNANFAMAEIRVPGEKDPIKVSRLIANRFEDGSFSISHPTGRKVTVDGKEVDELAPFITGRAVNRANDDPKMSSVSVSLYSREEGAALLDELAAAGDDKDARIEVYNKYQTQLWGFADRHIEEQTNEYFGIVPSEAYIARRATAATPDAPEADEPAPEEQTPARAAPVNRSF